MKDINDRSITEAVLASMSETSNARLKAVMTSLVSHLHDFAREIQLSEEEWFAAIEFLTSVGQISDDRRQEFVLLSDTLGLSMLVTSQNNHKPAGCTEPTLLGPFYVAEPPTFHNGADIANGALGTPCFVSGTVSGPNGQRISEALIDVWQSDEDGFYDVQRPAPDGLIVPQARGRLETLADGSFHFKSILAEAYPIPHDGPVGKMLAALGRHPWRPAHLHFWIRAEGFDPLITHIFRAGDKYIDSDAVFGVRSSLIVDWKHHDPGVTPDGSVSQTSFYTVAYDFVLSESDKATESLSASVSAAG